MFCPQHKSGNHPHPGTLRLALKIDIHFEYQSKYLPLTLVTQIDTMIISFGSKDTEKIWNGISVIKLPLEIQTIGRRKLRMINNSQNIQDLTVPPSNKLEKKKGRLKDYYSIRINDQWRIIFKWNNGNASDVEIIDYH